MINSSPVVFMSKGFFIRFLKLRFGNWSDYSFRRRRILIFLEELICHKSKLLVNIPANAIAEIVGMEESDLRGRFEGDELLFVYSDDTDHHSEAC